MARSIDGYFVRITITAFQNYWLFMEPSLRQAAGKIHRMDEHLFPVHKIAPLQAARNAPAITVTMPLPKRQHRRNAWRSMVGMARPPSEPSGKVLHNNPPQHLIRTHATCFYTIKRCFSPAQFLIDRIANVRVRVGKFIDGFHFLPLNVVFYPQHQGHRKATAGIR